MTELSSVLLPHESEHARQRKKAFMSLLLWLGATLALTVSSIHASDTLAFPQADDYPIAAGLLAASVIPWFWTLKHWKKLVELRRSWSEYCLVKERVAYLERLTQSEAVSSLFTDLQQQAKSSRLIGALLDVSRSGLNKRKTELRRQEMQVALSQEAMHFQESVGRHLEKKKQDLPLFKARARIQASMSFLQARREELKAQWEAAYEHFSWWNKIKYDGGPDFSELDKVLDGLTHINSQITMRHKDDFQELDRHFSTLKSKAVKRVVEAKGRADEYILTHAGTEGIEHDLLKKALLFSAMSVPVSVWSDLDRSGDVFDALRDVNGNFYGMSDAEIWWETLFLPTESLAGLVSLTKGAYFEQLVAADTDGALFEHFNHPGTDIVIDGTAFQLKATDSESYVNSVDDGIPVIATSEVADQTGAIDSGYSNEELTNAVDLALGGSVVDLGDGAVDAILSGVGGLGFFATLQGINHAVKQYENGGDPVEAAFEGAGVAIEGTARALVGAAEMGYKVLASRPSRFIGRMLLKGIDKLDKKMMADAERKSG
jgi:hypothetical protein